MSPAISINFSLHCISLERFWPQATIFKFGSIFRISASINIDDFSVSFRSKSIIHRFVINLEIFDIVRFRMTIGRSFFSPFSRCRVIDVMNPIHRVLNHIRICIWVLLIQPEVRNPTVCKVREIHLSRNHNNQHIRPTLH